jgi:hypothetical protein
VLAALAVANGGDVACSELICHVPHNRAAAVTPVNVIIFFICVVSYACLDCFTSGTPEPYMTTAQ